MTAYVETFAGYLHGLCELKIAKLQKAMAERHEYEIQKRMEPRPRILLFWLPPVVWTREEAERDYELEHSTMPISDKTLVQMEYQSMIDKCRSLMGAGKAVNRRVMVPVDDMAFLTDDSFW